MARGNKILMIGKGAEFVDVTQKAAEFSSWELVLAAERKDAIMKALGENPEVIILGYLEPQGEAFNLHKQLKENPKTKGIPLVVVDVSPEEQSAKGWRKFEGIDMQAEDYLCEPVNPLELAGCVERLLVEIKTTITT